MRLLRLKITDPHGLRSLQSGFEIHFLREWDYEQVEEFHPYILIGPNGSGKSNVLEALSAIFYHLHCVYRKNRPEIFDYDAEKNPLGFQGKEGTPDAFELEFFIRPDKDEYKLDEIISDSGFPELPHIKVVKEIDKVPQVFWMNRSLFEKNSDLILSRTEVEFFLPRYIVSYSSGENEILSLPFFKLRFLQYDEYMDFLIRDDFYSAPEGRMFYLDHDYSQAVMLANFLFLDEPALGPFREELEIKRIKQFRIILKKSIEIPNSSEVEFPKHLVREHDGEDGRKDISIEITDKARAEIQKLVACATTYYHDEESDTLYLDYWLNEETRKAFKLHFEKAIDLFQAFNVLLTLNLYSVGDDLKKDLYQSDSLYVKETVPILPSDQRIMRFKDFDIEKNRLDESIYSRSLSDGEYQFLHAIGLSLLFKDENCLFLLDEPETHFNPDWRSMLISRLHACFLLGNAKVLREMLITTHSPFLVSDSESSYVLLFKKENDQVTVSRPDFNTLGASVNKITMEAFGKRETIGEIAQGKLDNFKKRMKQGGDKDLIGQEVRKTLGDSIEKVLFLSSLEKEEEP